MRLPSIAGEFRLVEDPELRFTQSGLAVANVRLVADQQRFDKDKNEWVDDKKLWLNGSVWRQMAENVAESLRKGDLVVVRGSIHTREWEDREGNKRSTVEMMIDDIAPSLRFKPVLHSDGKGGKVTREGAASPTDPDDDPWATPASSDEPPF